MDAPPRSGPVSARIAPRPARLPAAALLVPALLALSARPAAAAPSVPEQAAAEALFREARELLDAGEIAEACGKLAESQRLDPRLGTLLNLATCHEKQGKTASAWGEFNEAAGMAMKTHQKARLEFAREHAAALEARLSRVVFKAAGAPPEGLQIKVGDQDLAAAALGTRIPLDPGKYPVKVTAPGKKPWSTEIDVPPGPATLDVDVPALADAPPALTSASGAAPAPGPTSSADRTALSTAQTVGLVLGGVGILGLGVGAYFGVRTISAQGTVEDNCHGKLCNQTGLDADDDAHASATVSTIAFAAGAALATGGVVLFLTSGPSDPPATAAAPRNGSARADPVALWLAPGVGSGRADLTFGGAW